MSHPPIQTLTLPAGRETPADVLDATRAKAAEILEAGGLVAVPTDTVYGIAVRADRPASVERLYRIKERPLDRSMTVHLGRADDASVGRHCASLPPVARRLARRFWPGALTLVVPGHVLPGDSAAGELVGLRVPDHELVQGILSAVPAPIVIPSANKSGAEPALNSGQVQELFAGHVDAIVDGGELPARAASTVVLARPDSWEVLREGAIETAAIRAAAVFQIVLVCTGNTCRSPMAEVVLRRQLEATLGVADLEQLGLEIRSGGVSAYPGAPASAGALRAAARRGLSLAEHRSRTMDPGLIHGDAHVYALTRSHLRAVVGMRPGWDVPVTLLDPEGADIPDPIGGDDAVYEETCARIERAIALRVPEILELAGLRR